VGKFSLSRHDTQARISAVLAIISCVSLAGLALLVFRNIDRAQWVIAYGKNRGLMVQAAAAVTILLAGIAFGMGLNSAGQRRNDRPKLSWLGFFIGALVICAALVLLFLFKTRGEQVYF
jgi:hypothetical protein